MELSKNENTYCQQALAILLRKTATSSHFCSGGVSPSFKVGFHFFLQEHQTLQTKDEPR